MKKENIVVIEATSSSINYIHEIEKLGYHPVCVELYCDEEEREMQRGLHDLQYALITDNPDILLADESYEKTFEMIKELDPILIIPGSDSGIVWANKMSYELGLPCNNPAILQKMMNKRCMQESLKKSNLRYIKSKAVTSLKEVEEFISETDSSKYVIKSGIGQASIGVCICKNMDEIIEAMKVNKDLDVLDNDEMIIQEYIGGDEYIVDSVSCNGVNRITAGYKYEKIQIEGGAAIYDYSISVDESDPLFNEIIEYHKKVIPAIGIEYGAIHGEYKVDDKGPVLMEVNCRVSGGLQLYSVENKAWGENHAGAALEAYLNLDEFQEKLNNELEIYQYYVNKDLIMPEECFVLESHVETVFEELDSFNYSVSFGENKVYPKTVDLSTAAGLVHLTNKDWNKLMDDVNFVRKMEKEEIDKIFTIKTENNA
ncbi:hypothetical protein TL18_07115 [Methanobrevibacter sp. YE315]|uniref:ATP-grasp domain-containing protein n=1 Tax=Methanobrevibacter sp. YE315 TaxID=1609968 RepID=UPI000764E7A0|nr:ATP-grasp domain-containing protein [Methanobrevibacter sp. YE315]AMD17807.1 hypothetical protein TL18_07115 [Methanobrevibacter sp. YE315]